MTIQKNLGENVTFHITIQNDGPMDWTFGIGLSLLGSDGAIYNCWSGGNSLVHDPLGMVPDDPTRGNIDSVFIPMGQEIVYDMMFPNPCTNGMVQAVVAAWAESTKPLLTQLSRYPSSGWIGAYESLVTTFEIRNTDWQSYTNNYNYWTSRGYHQLGQTLVSAGNYGQWYNFAIEIGLKPDPFEGYMTGREWNILQDASKGSAPVNWIKGVMVNYIPWTYNGFMIGHRIDIITPVGFERMDIIDGKINVPQADGSNGYFVIRTLDRSRTYMYTFNQFSFNAPIFA